MLGTPFACVCNSCVSYAITMLQLPGKRDWDLYGWQTVEEARCASDTAAYYYCHHSLQISSDMPPLPLYPCNAPFPIPPLGLCISGLRHPLPPL